MTTLADAFDAIFAQYESFGIPPAEIRLCNRKVKDLRDSELITGNEMVILAAGLSVLSTMVARRRGVSMETEIPKGDA